MGNHGAECRPDPQHGPAPFLPRSTQTGELNEEVHDIDRAVTDIRENAQKEESQEDIHRKRELRFGPADQDMTEHHGRKYRVIDDAARFPIPQCVRDMSSRAGNEACDG